MASARAFHPFPHGSCRGFPCGPRPPRSRIIRCLWPVRVGWPMRNRVEKKSGRGTSLSRAARQTERDADKFFASACRIRTRVCLEDQETQPMRAAVLLFMAIRDADNVDYGYVLAITSSYGSGRSSLELKIDSA